MFSALRSWQVLQGVTSMGLQQTWLMRRKVPMVGFQAHRGERASSRTSSDGVQTKQTVWFFNSDAGPR